MLALWNGLPISLWLVSNPIIQFFTYDSFKNYLMRRGKTALTALEAFFLGALAKAVATMCTYPLQVAQTRLRTSKQKSSDSGEGRGSIKEEHYRGILHCLEILYRTRGIKGLFQGLEAKLGQTVLTAAFMFMFYEKIAAALRAALLRK
jgi:adenine nucleotide transporter 17